MAKKSKNIPFGLHLMLDAYNCDPETLNDQNLVYNILDTLPEKIGMRKLMKPYVLFAEANDKRDPGGWSGFVRKMLFPLLIQSHHSVVFFCSAFSFTFFSSIKSQSMLCISTRTSLNASSSSSAFLSNATKPWDIFLNCSSIQPNCVPDSRSIVKYLIQIFILNK